MQQVFNVFDGDVEDSIKRLLKYEPGRRDSEAAPAALRNHSGVRIRGEPARRASWSAAMPVRDRSSAERRSRSGAGEARCRQADVRLRRSARAETPWPLVRS